MISSLAIMRRLFLAILVGALSLIAETEPSVTDPDTRIRFSGGEALSCSRGGGGACFQGCGLVAFKGNATRVVGRGLVSEGDVAPDGGLVNPNAYVNAGIVAPTAKLHLSWGGGSGLYNGWGGRIACTPYRITSRVTVNNVDVGNISVAYCDESRAVRSTTLDVPISALHFATRNASGPPTPHENIVRLITSNTASLPAECGDHDSNQVSNMYLDFEAMARLPWSTGWSHLRLGTPSLDSRPNSATPACRTTSFLEFSTVPPTVTAKFLAVI